MDNSALDIELEQQLEQEDESLLLLSTPRQRLEDARAMADGVIIVDDNTKTRDTFEENYCMADADLSSQSEGACGEEQESTHLLERLSGAMADNGDWKRFHDISRESQDTLAEINATLGSLRQWQKGRECPTAPSRHSEPSTAMDMSQEYPLDSEAISTTQRHDSTENVGSSTTSCQEQRCLSSNGIAEKEDALVALWKKHHQTALLSAERLREKLDPATSSGPCHPPTATNENKSIPRTRETAFDVLVRVARGEVSDAASGQDRAADLRRDTESLQMKQWIENVRTDACDRAEGTAREACEDIWRETAPVGTMEGELSCFTKELDSVLLKLDRAEDGKEENGPEDIIVSLSPREGGRAPAADTHVGCAE